MLRLVQSIAANEKGGTAVEYGLICSLIVIAALGAIGAFATKANGMWNNVSTAVTTAGY